MSVAWIVVVIVVGVLLIAALLLALARRARSRRLHQQFGEEYTHAVQGSGSRRKAEKELSSRSERREHLQIRPLDPALQREFGQRWARTQEAFVDDPAGSVQSADTLVTEVMRERGYPTGDFAQQARDVSVDHGSVTTRYRDAHEISVLNARGTATTEQLREAMVHYRALFSELLDEKATR